jgi:hypothetical protein
MIQQNTEIENSKKETDAAAKNGENAAGINRESLL